MHNDRRWLRGAVAVGSPSQWSLSPKRELLVASMWKAEAYSKNVGTRARSAATCTHEATMGEFGGTLKSS